MYTALARVDTINTTKPIIISPYSQIDANDVYPKAVCSSCEVILEEFIRYQAMVKDTQHEWRK